MDAFVFGTLTSICGTVLFESIKAACNSFTCSKALGDGLLEAFLEEIDEALSEIDYNEKSLRIKDFIVLPLVQDILQQYCSYKISGLASPIIRSNSSQEILTDEIISNNLYLIYTKFIDSKPDTQEQNAFVKLFVALLTVVKSNIFTQLSGENQAIVFLVNNCVAKAVVCISDKLDTIQQKLQESFSAPLPKLIDVNKVIKDEYNKLMKDNFLHPPLYLLEDYEFDQFYITPSIAKGELQNYNPLWEIGECLPDGASLRDNWKSIFFARNVVYIVGKAGYGKSLLLRKIVTSFHELNIMNASEHLVIYCDLKTFYSKNYSPKKSIVDFLQESMIEATGMDEDKLSKEFVEYYLYSGRCIILLDALDEVPKEDRRTLHKKIIAFFTVYSSNNKICITSRDRGFVPQKKLDILNILPLNNQDISDYLDKMIQLGRFKSSDKKGFLKQSEPLMRKHFLDSFLVLSLLVSIYRAERELPSNKIDLYKKCFDYIYKTREKEKAASYNWTLLNPLMKESTFISLSALSAPNNRNVSKATISNVLFDLYCKKFASEVETETALEEFFDFCSSRTELLVLSDSDDEYRFFHRSFFEFFYAKYINQDKTMPQIYEIFSTLDIDSEVFELVIALIKEENEAKYQKLLDFMIAKVEDEISNKEQRLNSLLILTLMMQIVDDSYYIGKYYDVFMQSYLAKRVHSDPHLFFMAGTWLYKATTQFPDKRQDFISVFGPRIACFVLQFLYYVRDNIEDYKGSNIVDSVRSESKLFNQYFDFLTSRNPTRVPLFCMPSISKDQIPEIVSQYVLRWSSMQDISRDITFEKNVNLARTYRGIKVFNQLNDQERKDIAVFVTDLGRYPELIF